MARAVAGGLSYLRTNDPTNPRAVFSIVAREGTEKGTANGLMTFIDEINTLTPFRFNA